MSARKVLDDNLHRSRSLVELLESMGDKSRSFIDLSIKDGPHNAGHPVPKEYLNDVLTLMRKTKVHRDRLAIVKSRKEPKGFAPNSNPYSSDSYMQWYTIYWELTDFGKVVLERAKESAEKGIYLDRLFELDIQKTVAILISYMGEEVISIDYLKMFLERNPSEEMRVVRDRVTIEKLSRTRVNDQYVRPK